MRHVLVDQDLSGQTIEGQPFSYVGRCRGADVKFVGDWTHVSHFQNDFLRPDWSKAKTAHSYSRFNTFIDAKVSDDMNAVDHDMLLATLDASLPRLTGTGKTAMTKAADMLRTDVAAKRYLISWSNVAPVYMQEFSGDYAKAMETAAITAERKPQLLKQVAKTSSSDPNRAMWSDSKEPTRNVEGVTVAGWGVVARNREGKEYRRHWSRLPAPTNPHDRLEMAELIEAEVLAATGLKVSFYIRDILPWRAYAIMGTHERDWFAQ